MSEWTDWVDAWIVRRETTAAAVSELAGYNKATISKWRRGARPAPDDVRTTAAALQAPLRDAMIAAGIVYASEWDVPVAERPISEASDDELLHEMARRLRVASDDPKPSASGVRADTAAKAAAQRGRRVKSLEKDSQRG